MMCVEEDFKLFSLASEKQVAGSLLQQQRIVQEVRPKSAKKWYSPFFKHTPSLFSRSTALLVTNVMVSGVVAYESHVIFLNTYQAVSSIALKSFIATLSNLDILLALKFGFLGALVMKTVGLIVLLYLVYKLLKTCLSPAVKTISTYLHNEIAQISAKYKGNNGSEDIEIDMDNADDALRPEAKPAVQAEDGDGIPGSADDEDDAIEDVGLWI